MTALTSAFGFDAAFYTANYQDLADFPAQMAHDHFVEHGVREGRQGHPLGNRQAFTEYARSFQHILEVGPFYTPTVRGDNVRYLDVLDENQLRARAELLGLDASGCPERIHYVGDIFGIHETFDAVVSSHCIEHQPDLVHHLEGVARVLKPGGQYLLYVPDKRYCFDHFIPQTTIADVIQAHDEQRTMHTLRSVIEHHALTTHNNAHAHWAGDHGEQFPANQRDRVNEAVRMFETSDTYIDVHCWTFTPDSFWYITNLLYEQGMSKLKPISVYPTLFNGLEFFAVLSFR